MDIAKRLMALCEQRRLSINALADKSGVTQSTLHAIVSGRNTTTTVATIEKVCEGLEITLGQFFADERPLNPALSTEDAYALRQFENYLISKKYTSSSSVD